MRLRRAGDASERGHRRRLQQRQDARGCHRRLRQCLRRELSRPRRRGELLPFRWLQRRPVLRIVDRSRSEDHQDHAFGAVRVLSGPGREALRRRVLPAHQHRRPARPRFHRRPRGRLFSARAQRLPWTRWSVRVVHRLQYRHLSQVQQHLRRGEPHLRVLANGAMALTATIHHFTIRLSDFDRGVYETLELKAAKHPSESDEYLVTRVLAYCLEYAEGIAFSRGLSEPDEPPIAVRDLTGALKAWIEIGGSSGSDS